VETPAPGSTVLGPRGASVCESFLTNFTFVKTLIKFVMRPRGLGGEGQDEEGLPAKA
jgi:hypothetical protein